MASKMTHTIRAELANAVRRRYRAATGKQKRRILDEFIARTRDECARRVIYKTARTAHHLPPTYHPFLVGEDFLYQSGVIAEFGKLGREQACE